MIPIASPSGIDTVELMIMGHRFYLSVAQAHEYAAQIRHAACNCERMLDIGLFPCLVSDHEAPVDPELLAANWLELLIDSNDFEGKRFWIGALYLISGDHQSAITYLEQLLNSSKGNIDDPVFWYTYLVAALMVDGSIEPGGRIERICFNLHIANPFMLDLALGNKIELIDNRVHFTDLSRLNYAKSIPRWLYKLLEKQHMYELREWCGSVTYQMFTTVDKLLNQACIPQGIKELSELKAFHKRYSI